MEQSYVYNGGDEDGVSNSVKFYSHHEIFPLPVVEVKKNKYNYYDILEGIVQAGMHIARNCAGCNIYLNNLARSSL